jgi:hypothetical protein
MLPTGAKTTMWVITILSFVLAAWDVYLTVNKFPGDTISEVMLKVAKDHPILPFIIGVIIGHLFWPQKM